MPEPISDIPENFTVDAALLDCTKIEAMIPMRDGVKLYTLIIIPKSTPVPAPILMTRTPYGADNVLTSGFASKSVLAMMSPAENEFLEAGFIRVYQDARGKFKSEGVYEMYRPPIGNHVNYEVDHVTDTYDTIEWLIHNVPNNNGNVGMTGVSYPGYLTLIPLLGPHPSLKALVPINPVVDMWMGDDFYHNGAFRLSELEYFYRQTASKDNSQKPPYGVYDVYDFYLRAGNAENAAKTLLGSNTLPAWERMARRTTYDTLWQANALDRVLDARLSDLTIPTLNVHSWFDAEDIYGPMAAYEVLEKKDKNQTMNFLVAGPWVHGQSMREGSNSAAIKWDANTSKWFRKNIMIPFLAQHLKNETPSKPLARVYAFNTGTNEWHSFDNWYSVLHAQPPKDATAPSLYLNRASSITTTPPNETSASHSFVSDPAKPVPYRVRPIVSRLRDGSTWSTWLLDDQRPFSDRPDVLIFCSSVLSAPITIAGAVQARLFAAISGNNAIGNDADWVVKLIDVYPDEYPSQPELGGYQLMITGEILRGRYRGGEHADYANPKPIAPDQITEFVVRMPHAFHTFQRGHRIMVQIQSTWFPLNDRNPQTYVDSIYSAPAESYTIATHHIHHSRQFASRIEILGLLQIS